MGTVLLNRIAECRKAKNLSNYAIEKGAGLTIGSIKNWGRSIPSADKILRVANFLDVSVDYLLGNTDNPQSHKNNPQDFAAAAAEFSALIMETKTSTANIVTTAAIQMDELLKAHNIDPNPDGCGLNGTDDSPTGIEECDRR